MNRLDYYRPTLADSWIMTGLYFAGNLLISAIMLVLKICFSISLEYIFLSYILSMLFPFVYLYVKSGKAVEDNSVPLSRADFGRLGALRYLVLAIAGILLLCILEEPLTVFIPMPQSVKRMFEAAFISSALWDNVLSACILAPLCEEFLCRGMMMRGMLKTMSPKKAILWSALIFAVLHMNPWQSIPAFLIGIFLGWTYYRSGSLWVPIVLHCVNNSLATLLSRLLPDMEIDQGLIDLIPAGTYIIIYIASAAAFAAVLYILKSNDEKTLSA